MQYSRQQFREIQRQYREKFEPYPLEVVRAATLFGTSDLMLSLMEKALCTGRELSHEEWMSIVAPQS